MSQGDVRNLLSQLKVQIDEIASEETGSNERLERISNELDQVLSSPELNGKNRFLTNLEKWVNDVEASHPHLTEAINQISNSLGSMGI